MTALRIGVIGNGYWGPNIIRNFAENQMVDLVAVADRDPARLEHVRQRHRQVEHLVSDHRGLFDLELDAVAVCTPPETHFEIAADCMRAGLHAMVEKPMTVSTDEAKELCGIASDQDRILMVGHTFEYNPAVRALKAMVGRGDAGEVRYVDAVRVGLGLFHPRLNVIWDLAPHDISILVDVLGQVPTTVSAVGSACLNPKVHDVAYVTLGFPSGVSAHIRLSWLDPMKTRKLTVVGSEKMIVYDDVALSEKVKVYDHRVDAMPRTDSFGEFQFDYHHGDVVSPNINFQEPLKLEVAEFVECVLKGRKPKTDGASGVRVVKVIEAAQESLLSGGKTVTIPSDEFDLAVPKPVHLEALHGSVAR